MAIPMFLAMTGAEWRENSAINGEIAWMACHFSPYSTGLSNRPKTLPPQSMLILNDRTPVYGHDPELIADQLAETVAELDCRAVLLDFQRPGEPETAAITEAILSSCPCPVAVTAHYAQQLDCPIFLPPVPLNVPPKDYLDPWTGREVWLETALDGLLLTLTADGAQSTPLPAPEPGHIIHQEPALFCHYDITVQQDRIHFQLYRTREDITSLLAAAEALGVTCAVGLYQEFAD